MKHDLTRRTFLGAAGMAATAGATAAAANLPIKILGIGCSPRDNSSTAIAVQVALDAAREVAPDIIEVELIKLAGLRIPGQVAAGVPLDEGERDDFPSLVPKLGDPSVAGIIIGSPVYFGNMSSLCKAFLERLTAFRKGFVLSNTVAGVLAVGGSRNGGQELTIKSIQTSLFCHEMIIVGETRPTAHFGPAGWNNSQFGGITGDELGTTIFRALGRRVADVARTVVGV